MSRAQEPETVEETDPDGYARNVDVRSVDADLTTAAIEIERPDGFVERVYLSETETRIVEDGLREAREGSE